MSFAGRMAFKWVFKPKADLVNYVQDLRIYGLRKQEIMRAFHEGSELALVETLSRLNQIHRPGMVKTDVYYLGGDAVFPLIACSIVSLIKAAGDGWRFHLLPDKSGFSADLVGRFRDFGGSIQFHQEKILQQEVDEMLASRKYPILRKLRAQFLLARKLIDLNAAGRGYKIFIDADTVFWREPAEMSSLIHKRTPFAQTDFQDAYVVARDKLEILCDSAMPSCVNTGLIGLDSGMMDWNWMEYCCGRIHTLPEMGGPGANHCLEQTLYAFMFAKMHGFTLLSKSHYRVMPDIHEVKNPKAVFHHYVFPCRHLFYKYAWQQILSK